LDSAKNKKSFPDFSDTPIAVKGEFEAFREIKLLQFSLPSALWQSIEKDPVVKAEFDQRVEARAQEIILSETSAQRAAVFEEARQAGLAAGVAEGKEQVDKSCAALSQIVARVIEDKQILLKEHEAVWCEAVRHLMKRFLVPLTVERMSTIQAWLEQAIGELGEHAKIRLLVGPNLHSDLAGKGFTVSKCDWVLDKSLTDREIRVEIVGGGIFFSLDEEWKKFERFLDELLGSATV
jgi:flagellar biosynthesis/type III secretory pathway protein FliH